MCKFPNAARLWRHSEEVVNLGRSTGLSLARRAEIMEEEMSPALTVGQATFSKIRIFCTADAEVPRFTDTDLMEKTWRPLATFTKAPFT